LPAGSAGHPADAGARDTGAAVGHWVERGGHAIPTVDLDLALTADCRQVAEARHRMSRHLDARGIDGEVADNAILLVSELVTNAILHGEAPVAVRVQIPDDHLHVEVHDADSEATVLVPRAALLPQERLGGRGLRLVDTLASRWGLAAYERGKCIWFEIDLL
jgi:anti-sigma regulatory factor (Ser/Thr protein kinase)